MEIKVSDTEYYGKVEMIGQFWERKDFITFDEWIEKYLLQGKNIIIMDLLRVSFISSQALGKIVRAYSRITETGGRFVLLVPTGSVREMIAIAGFTDFMNIFSSLQELDMFLEGHGAKG